MLKTCLTKLHSLCSFFKTFFIYQYVNIFIVIITDIYLCKKHCHLLCGVYKKKKFFSLFTPQFFIQKFIRILHVKWIWMNMGESRLKIRSLNDPKVFLLQLRLIFYLQSNTLLYHLNGFTPFSPMKNIFLNSLINS